MKGLEPKNGSGWLQRMLHAKILLTSTPLRRAAKNRLLKIPMKVSRTHIGKSA